MSATALRPASREVAPFTTADLTLAETGEPTVLDVVLAERLGFVQTRDIRKLIERNREELEAFGNLRHRGAKSEGRGRPGREFHLNRQQALLVTILSKTSIAAQVRRQMIVVFDAALAGMSAPQIDRRPDDDDRSALSRRQLADVTTAIVQAIPAIVESVLAARALPPVASERIGASSGGKPDKAGKSGKPVDPALSEKRREAGRLGGLRRAAILRDLTDGQAVARVALPAPAMPATPPSDLLYGLAAIGAHLGMTARQAKHRALSGHIPVFKIGHSVCASRRELAAWLNAVVAGERASAKVPA